MKTPNDELPLVITILAILAIIFGYLVAMFFTEWLR